MDWVASHTYACQIGLKCQKVIFVWQVAIFMSELQFICPEFQYNYIFIYPNATSSIILFFIFIQLHMLAQIFDTVSIYILWIHIFAVSIPCKPPTN